MNATREKLEQLARNMEELMTAQGVMPDAPTREMMEIAYLQGYADARKTEGK